MPNYSPNEVSTMTRIRSLLVLLALTVTLSAVAQEFPKYGKPVDIPIYLSATFGELRPNHLHAGLDIKTQGVEGKKIYAVADGLSAVSACHLTDMVMCCISRITMAILRCMHTCNVSRDRLPNT